MKLRVISLHKKREEKLRAKTAQKLTAPQAAEVCEVLESDKDLYKNVQTQKIVKFSAKKTRKLCP